MNIGLEAKRPKARADGDGREEEPSLFSRIAPVTDYNQVDAEYGRVRALYAPSFVVNRGSPPESNELLLLKAAQRLMMATRGDEHRYPLKE